LDYPAIIYKFGTYTVRAKEEAEAEETEKRDALLLQEAGCFGLVTGKRSQPKLGKTVSESLSIPTIGIGAGNVLRRPRSSSCTICWASPTEFQPRFLRRYLRLDEEITGAVQHYIRDVKTKRFPQRTKNSID